MFGPDIRWLFLIGVTLQAVVMLEMARYAMATGESIFFGAARVFKPLMWFFFVVAILDLHLAGSPVGGRGRVRADHRHPLAGHRDLSALVLVGVRVHVWPR